MRHPTLPITLGLIGLALSTLTISAAATPAAAAAHHSIRYASVDACTAKDGATTPCHTWRLDLLDGKRVTLKDAMVWPLTAKGKPNKEMQAPLSVSGDGESVAYFRKSDHRLVVREFHGSAHAMGPVHVMPKKLLPRGVGMDDAWVRLSQDGARLILGYSVKDGSNRARIFDVPGARETGTITAFGTFSGFSGDGSAVLVEQDTDENTTELGVYDTEGDELARVVPPQIVAANVPWALSSDDRTVAFVTGAGKKARLRFYDATTDQTTGSVGFSLPSDAAVEMIDWTGEHEVTLHLIRSAKVDHVTILRVDTRTGKTRVRDSYKVRAGTFTYQSCGG
ncbi:hypothetical protein [Microbispora sp. GKU 823]|uniref:hypothetical protein n=1 Tax=Microbispora sp. GKU 823 TaxID=1652100 RepID=UPI0009D18E50|nr:hypothetical protein [Microbispora sp. GKU 823]OPG11376.1 hypothetical protein B1L11_20345 [Microbispora sp. GKU 823]